MNKRVFSLMAAAGLALAVPLAAVAADPPQFDWQHYSWEVPLEFGEYIAVPGGDSVNLGALAIGVTPDSRNTLGGAIYHYGADGKMIVQGINGTLTRNDDTTLRDTGVIAHGPLTAYDLSNGPCRTCPPGSATATPTAEQISWEWTGPRAGTLTVDGVTQHMAHAFSGPPLAAPVDLSGTWMIVFREDAYANNQTYHAEGVQTVTLTAVTEPRTYTSAVWHYPDNSPPWGSVALPPPGARLYDMRCANRGCTLGNLGAEPGRELTFWFDAGNAGRLMRVELSGAGASTERVVYDRGYEQMRAYASDQHISARRSAPLAYGPTTPYIQEIGLFRIDPQTLRGDTWRQPTCVSGTFIPDCNSGI